MLNVAKECPAHMDKGLVNVLEEIVVEILKELMTYFKWHSFECGETGRTLKMKH